MNNDDYGDAYDEDRSRNKRHSVPLRTHQRPGIRTTEDSVPVLFPVNKQRPVNQQQSRSAPTQSYTPHTALPTFPDDDRQVGKSQLRFIDSQGNHVWRQGKQQIVFHSQEPPPRRRLYWLPWIGGGMLLTIGLVVGWNVAIAAIQAHSLDAQYGYPRTWQTDAVVGHEDSTSHPSHFIFENLRGQVLITEYPGGNIAHARIYSGGTIFQDHADQVPITGSFADVNGDGRPDMVVEIGTGTENTPTITFLNNGTQFVPSS